MQQAAGGAAGVWFLREEEEEEEEGEGRGVDNHTDYVRVSLVDGCENQILSKSRVSLFALLFDQCFETLCSLQGCNYEPFTVMPSCSGQL